ncbi:hypothetical protein CK485_12335 [Streptomyces sp. ICBB 8177]|nr:hypothetical protein CK485_12335 [Streptomyces sp. ICBB 8177]
MLRVLGLRHLAQGVALSVTGRPAAVGVGVAADVLHAVSALGLARYSKRWRTGAVADFVLASAFAAAGALALTRQTRRAVLSAAVRNPTG